MTMFDVGDRFLAVYRKYGHGPDEVHEYALFEPVRPDAPPYWCMDITNSEMIGIDNITDPFTKAELEQELGGIEIIAKKTPEDEVWLKI